MKVFILTSVPFPNGMASTSRIKCYARALSEGGLECEVIIYRRTELYGKPALNLTSQGKYANVQYRYISAPQRDSRALVRKFDDFFDILRTKRYLYKSLHKGDVLFLYMGGNTSLIINFMNIAKKKGAFCIRDLCELPYVTTGKETYNTIRSRYHLIINQFPQLDGIISISDSLSKLARVYAADSCKHLKVPIMVEYENFKVEMPVRADIPYIFHAGTLYQQKDGILGMIEAFGIAKQKLNKPIKYILTGNISSSSHPELINSLIKKYNLESSIEFVGYLNHKQIQSYLSSASLVISNRPKSKQDYYGFSTKVGEYLASGVPLLTTNWGEVVNWLKNDKSAYIVEPGDVDALAEAIVYVFTHPEESRQVGLAGQEVCLRHFDYRNWSKPLVEFLLNL